MAVFQIKLEKKDLTDKNEDLQYCSLSYATSRATTPIIQTHPTYTGSFQLRRIALPARLLVGLALCAHDTGIPSRLYRLTPDPPVLTSIVFSLQQQSAL